MAITNKIICNGKSDYSNKMLCEYEVICDNPLKVKAVLRWQDSVIDSYHAYVRQQQRMSLPYVVSRGLPIGEWSKKTTHNVLRDTVGNCYITKTTHGDKYKIYL